MTKYLRILVLSISSIFFLSQANKADAQVDLGIGLEPVVPVGGTLDFITIGMGPTVNFHVAATDQFMVGAIAGYLFLLEKDNVDNQSFALIPLQTDFKYIFTGDAEDGGLYGNAQFGVHTLRSNINENINSESELSYSLGIGYMMETGLDITLKYQWITDGNSNVENPKYVGLRVGYNFL